MDEMQKLIRAEMAHVLSEIATTEGHRNILGAAASPFDPFHSQDPGADRLTLLKERVVTLEDTLAKSEADRAAAYAKLDQAERALSAAHEEKLALMHEYHDSNHGPVAEATMLLTAAQEDNHRLRHQLTLLSEKYDDDVPGMRQKIREQDAELKKLKKALKTAKDAGQHDAVTLADLHFSNERLSAQLARLQLPSQAPPVFDAKTFQELEDAVLSLTNELAAMDAATQKMKRRHEHETKRLASEVDKAQQELAIERRECDKVVQAMMAKLETLMEEVTVLRAHVPPGVVIPKSNASFAATPLGRSPGPVSFAGSSRPFR